MKAVQILKIDAPLEDREIERPAPKTGEVLVRVSAAGICHSDAHYRSGTSPVGRLPMTPGHEVAGIVEEVGSRTEDHLLGRRVCLHYLVTCGLCSFCLAGQEQFCRSGQMIGKHRDGGYAEFVRVPVRNAVAVPGGVSDLHAAIMMCSTATSYHALHQARLVPGETVAVVGCGGLGMSAILLARIMGAGRIFAVDVDTRKLEIARDLGAEAIDGLNQPAEAIRELTSGRGVDTAVELIGKKETFELAVQVLSPKGRAALAGISTDRISVQPYPDLINREAEVIGVSDHLLSELEVILGWAAQGKLDLTPFVSRSVPLEAGSINTALDDLESGTSTIRSIIVPDL